LEIENNDLILKNIDIDKWLELNSKLQMKKNAVRKALKEKGILVNKGNNDFDNYSYFSESQYKELFTELFAEHKLDFKPNQIGYSQFNGTDKQPMGRNVTFEFTLMDAETGFFETSVITGEAIDKGDKATYKADTGALKYYFANTFLVATGDDPENPAQVEKKAIIEKKQTIDKRKSSEKKSSEPKITPGQIKMMKTLYETDVDQLKKELAPLKKKKIEELTMKEASLIIDKKKKENK